MEGNLSELPLSTLMNKVSHFGKYQSGPLFRQHDLKPGAAGILFTLDKVGTLSQRELADKIGITPPSMTVALQKMEKQGYISRRHDENDQRIIRIEIQEAGKKCVSVVKAAIQQLDEVMLEGFTDDEKLLLRRLLLRMYDNLIKHNEWEEEALHKCFQNIDMEREQ